MVPTNYTKIWELNLDVAITKHNPKLQLINVIQEKNGAKINLLTYIIFIC
jgi:uncharacterized protein with PQ loop repeat